MVGTYRFERRPCLICGTDATTVLGLRVPRSFELPDELKATIVRCRSCGLIYPNPMPVADEARAQADYGDPDRYFPNAISAERMRFYESVLLKIERAQGGRRGRLLDVGCGRGELLSVASERGWRACGVEKSRAFADYARKRFSAQVFSGELAQASLPESSQDVVTLISVLQHALDPKALLSAARRALKPGGLLFIEAMNNASLIYTLGDLYYRLQGQAITTQLSPTFPSYQLYGFSRKSLALLLEAAGFEVERIEIRGGISTLRPRRKGLGDRLATQCLKLTMVLANILGQGQVLEATARKPLTRL